MATATRSSQLQQRVQMARAALAAYFVLSFALTLALLAWFALSGWNHGVPMLASVLATACLWAARRSDNKKDKSAWLMWAIIATIATVLLLIFL